MNDFERVKNSINLADYIGRYATLKRAGSGVTCCCPLPGHDDRHPSFSIKEDRWECFGKCGVGGDIFDFVQRYHGWTLSEALIELAREYNITLEPLSPEHKSKQDHRARLYALMDEATNFYHTALYAPDNAAHLAYLKDKRGLSLATINDMRLGYAAGQLTLYKHLTALGYSFQEMLDVSLIGQGENKPYDFFYNRITIPVRDHKGRVVGFSARSVEANHPKKYLLPKETEQGLFHKSKLIHKMPSNQSTSRFAGPDTYVIVEGTMDPVSGLNCGVTNIVSIMGTSLSDEQLALLCSEGITRLVFCLDNDTTGSAALRRLVEKHMHTAADKGVDLYAMTVPHGKDPDDTFREMPHLWQGAVDDSRPVVDVLLERESVSLPKDPTPAQKQAWGLKMLPLLKGANGFVNEDNVRKLAACLNSSVETVTGWTQKQVQLTILPHAPKSLPMQNIPNLPSLELQVLHGILINEDPQRWLDRANAVLGKMPFPKTCAPLSQNDFSHPHTRAVMAMITTAISNGIRPFDDEVKTQIGRGVFCEAYERAILAPEAQAVFAAHDKRPAFVLDYDTYLRRVYRLRQLRLEQDVQHKLIPGSDLVEWVQAKLYLGKLLNGKGAGV